MAVVEIKEHYNDLLSRIRNLGPTKVILRNETLVKQIIAYSGDRHLLCAFFDMVNKDLEKGVLTEEDMQFFRSGKLMDAIVNLDRTIGEVHPREAFISERLDKINYVSLINDPQTLAVSYTHPAIINALCGGKANQDFNVRDLTWWRDCGTFNSLDPEVRTLIATEVLKNGSPTAALELLHSASGHLKPCNRETFENKTGFTR